MDRSRRRVVLGTLGAAGLAGCLEGGADTQEQADDPDPPASSPADGTPTATPEATDPSPTATPEGPTPAEDGSSASQEGADSTQAGSEETPEESRDDEVFPGYEMATVAVRAPGGERLGVVRAAVADTGDLRYTGLGDTESLPENYGMLFVFEEVDEWTFVMREMEFGIDIVFADSEGVITTIHHAPAPGPDEDGEEQRYPGRGQYVLEVNRGWTTERGVEEGDVLAFDLPE